MTPFEIGRLTRLELGYVGENNSREIQIDMNEWLERWPDGKIAVDVLKPGRKEYYLADTTVEDGILTWTVSYTDVAAAGRGMAQISIHDFGTGRVYKSRTVETIIKASADMEEDLEAPHPMDTWVARAVEAKEGALAAGAVAEEQARAATNAAAEAAESANAAENSIEGVHELESRAEMHANDSAKYAGQSKLYATLAEQSAATHGFFYTYIGDDGHLHYVRSDGMEDLELRIENGRLIASYGVA